MFTSGSLYKKLALTFLMTAVWYLAFTINSKTLSQQTDDPLFPIWDESGKEGFIDASGKTIVAPQFDKVTGFSEGMAAVLIGDKWGYIDRTGKVMIPPRWKAVYPFSDGVAAVVDGTHGYAYTPLPEEGDGYEISLAACGYINKVGQYVVESSIERKMSECPQFVEGLAPVCFNPVLKIHFPEFADAGLCGYLNKSGKWGIKPQYEAASNFSEGLALVRLRKYYDKSSNAWLNDFAFIDNTGKIVIDLKGYLSAHQFREGLAQVSNLVEKVGFLDRTGQSRLEVRALAAGDFSHGRALIQDPVTKLFGYVDQTGKWLIPPKYKRADSFLDGLASVCPEPQRCIYINPDGNVVGGVDGDTFRGVLTLRHLYTRTIHETPDFRNIYGYMNKAGKYVWVSPGGEMFLKEKWWRENYIGPHMPITFPLS